MRDAVKWRRAALPLLLSAALLLGSCGTEKEKVSTSQELTGVSVPAGVGPLPAGVVIEGEKMRCEETRFTHSDFRGVRYGVTFRADTLTTQGLRPRDGVENAPINEVVVHFTSAGYGYTGFISLEGAGGGSMIVRSSVQTSDSLYVEPGLTSCRLVVLSPPAPAPLATFRGTTPTETPTFDTMGGTVRFKVAAEAGVGPFDVVLVDDLGRDVPGGVIFTIGEREKVEPHPRYLLTRTLLHVAPGRYRLKVVATEEWKVSVTEVPSD